MNRCVRPNLRYGFGKFCAIENIAQDRFGAGCPDERCPSAERVIPATWWPALMSNGSKGRPIAPVAPATRTFMTSAFRRFSTNISLSKRITDL